MKLWLKNGPNVGPKKVDDRMSAPKNGWSNVGPKNGRPKVGPKNWMTEGRILKMDDGRSAP